MRLFLRVGPLRLLLLLHPSKHWHGLLAVLYFGDILLILLLTIVPLILIAHPIVLPVVPVILLLHALILLLVKAQIAGLPGRLDPLQHAADGDCDVLAEAVVAAVQVAGLLVAD
jgi:hypothetical protein